MKKLTLVGVSFLALGCASNGFAADIAVPPPVAPTWAGFYAGATAGGAWGSFDPQTVVTNNTYFTTAANAAAVNAAGMQSINPRSFAGGLEAGYNWQWGGWVAGLEADLESFRLEGRAINGGPYPTPLATANSFAITTSINSNWLFTARPRLGYAVNNGLFYVTGGLALTSQSANLMFGDGVAPNKNTEAGTFATTRVGGVIGGGVEMALSDRWSVKGEYLYVDFRQTTLNGAIYGSPAQLFSHSTDVKENIARLGINYHFVPGPVAHAPAVFTKAPPAGSPGWNWSGLYLGYNVGSAMALTHVGDPLGASIFGDDIHSPGFLGGGQIGYNWQLPGSGIVWGVQLDESFADLDGTNTCYAVSGTFTSLNCRAHTSSLGTLTGRVGLAFGDSGRSIVYVKGGLGWAQGSLDSVVNNEPFNVVAGTRVSSSFTSAGGTVGIGAEYALTAHLTAFAEYDYLGLGSHNITVPAQSITTTPAAGTFVSTAVPGTSASEQIHVFKMGMNYKFGPDVAPFATALAWPAMGGANYTKAPAIFKAPAIVPAAWAVEVGGRYWYSTGRFQLDLAPGLIGAQNPTTEISRLTWEKLNGHSGEVFGRADSPYNVFVKGFVGGGVLTAGKTTDEDWGLQNKMTGFVTPYSNTVGNASGQLSYATADLGYDVVRGPGYKVGAFVGYNIYTENKTSTTCYQIALPASGMCNPPVTTFILGDNDKWQSLRVGTNSEVMLTPYLRLTADMAFLPYVNYRGQDFHPLRPFLAEDKGTGIGAQTEVFLDYLITPQFSVGVGGRYWSMWTTTGTECQEPPNGGCPAPASNLQYKTERYGMTLQSSYKF
jgi:opacity protein-like surface antigen